MAEERYLAIYLNDHLAGSVAGIELTKRAAGNNEGTPVGEFLKQLVTDIDEDRAALEGLLDERAATQREGLERFRKEAAARCLSG